MAVLGEGLKGGWFRRNYTPENPAGLWLALLFAVLLVGLYQVLQLVLASAALPLLSGAATGNVRDVVKASLVVILPAALIVAAVAWPMARVRGGDPWQVLSLRRPQITGLGWITLVVGFLVVMYIAIIAIVVALGIDMNQYTPGPDGQTPQTGSTGLVKEAMFDIANEPWLFALVLPSVALGAPIAEEIIFRGQLFSALSRSPVGVSGATLATAALWSLLHLSEPWLSVGMIFVMGLVFGWMMYRFGSLWVTMACHAAWNTIFALTVFAGAGPAA